MILKERRCNIMSTQYENSKTNQYIFRYSNGKFSEVITYRNHLIEAVKKHPEAAKIPEIQNFSSKSVTDDKFERFTEIARNAGFIVYQLSKL